MTSSAFLERHKIGNPFESILLPIIIFTKRILFFSEEVTLLTQWTQSACNGIAANANIMRIVMISPTANTLFWSATKQSSAYTTDVTNVLPCTRAQFGNGPPSLGTSPVRLVVGLIIVMVLKDHRL